MDFEILDCGICGVFDLGILTYGIEDLRTWGIWVSGDLVVFCTCVRCVCVGVPCCKFEMGFVSCIVYLELGVLGFLISWVSVMLYVCSVYGVCLNIVSWMLEAWILDFVDWCLLCLVFCFVLFYCICEPCVLNIVHLY